MSSSSRPLEQNPVPSVYDTDGTGNLVAALRRALGRPIVRVRFRSDEEAILRSSPERFSAKGDFRGEGTVLLTDVEIVEVGPDGPVQAVLPALVLDVTNLPEPVSILDYLAGESRSGILSAMHHDLPYEVAEECDALHRRVADETGVYPALYSADFLTGQTVPHRRNMIDEVIRQGQDGLLVQIMFHVSPPQFPVDQEGEGGWGTDAAEETLAAPNRVYSYLDEGRWRELMTPGTALHATWLDRMDEYARLLVPVQDAGVTVMLRPFHEMNQHVFWWGGRPGRDGTAGLFRMFRERLEGHWGLRNIIWVWNVQDLPDDYGFDPGDEKFARYRGLPGGLGPYDADEWASFSPGADAYDILSVDFYDDEGYSPRRYAQARRIAEADGKPIIIGETFVLPSAEVRRDQPEWALAMPWGLRTWRYNDAEALASFYRGSVGAADLPRFRGADAG